MRFTRKLLSLAVLGVVMLIVAVAALPLWAQEEGAPSIPHAIPAHVDCLSCHGKTVGIGEEHGGRTDDTCTGCHRVANAQGIPSVPHLVQGQKCLTCHAAGGIKPFPNDHTFRTEQVCLNCHQVSPTASAAPSAAQAPAVPHATAGREDCLQCHGAGQVRPVPSDHAGRTSDMCLGCHEVSAAAAAATPVTAPAVPHATAGRDDCVSCHGSGQMRPFPVDHQGRTNDVCLGCHKTTTAATTPPSTSVVPTPISEPKLFGENSCVTCHQGLGGASAQNTADWQASVHASQGVGCVSCHGGDPNQADESAMSPSAGFVGVPTRALTPGLCASCHSNVELMRPYNIPIDQFEQYWQSQHGKALLTGDGNVATCFDCHGGHKVMKVDDPAATVYPTNEPATCARCHAAPALMASYGIPTDQYDLYQGSVHGTAVLQKQDPRAPTCSTCHGVHGAAPPGFTQIATVCGQCHSATQDYYQKGAHKAGLTGQGGPGCITCHGQHDVTTPALDLFQGTEDRHCGMCHAAGSPTAGEVEVIYQALKGADDAYAQAQAAITRAGTARLIVVQQEEALQKANTPLIEARALQHTVSVTDIQAKAKESTDLSQQAQASAEAALKDIGNRRIGMAVALAVILLVIVSLILIKLDLDRRLEAERARAEASGTGPRPG
jgi:hypothetical protein